MHISDFGDTLNDVNRNQSGDKLLETLLDDHAHRLDLRRAVGIDVDKSGHHRQTIIVLGGSDEALDGLRTLERSTRHHLGAINLHVERNLAVALSYKQLGRCRQLLINTCNGSDAHHQGHHT